MKRAAEKQLIKDSMDEDDEIEETSGEGFRKADEQVLAKRVIRGLPKRASISSIDSTTTEVAAPPPITNGDKPKFSGFGGFGATSGSASTFTFTPPPSTTPSLSSIPQTNSSNGSFLSNASTPTVSSSASNATKTFASFLSTSTEKSTPTSGSGSDDPEELKYYLALRGLNVSFISAVNKAIESDPFTDVSELLEHYKELRIQAVKEYDTKSSTTKTSNPATQSSSFSFSKPPDKAQPPAFSMPAPPPSFAGFPPPSASFPTSAPKSSSEPLAPFVPPKPSPSAETAPTSTAPAVSAFLTPGPPKSAFNLFGTSSNSTAPSSNPFGSGTSSGAGFFGSGASTSTTSSSADKTTPPSFGFGSSNPTNIFGKPDDQATGDKLKSSPFTSGSSTGLFGAPASSSSGSTNTNPFGGGGGFSFGSTTTTPPKPTSSNIFAGFGKTSPGGSIGNPVGYGFGAPPPSKGSSEEGSSQTIFSSTSQDNNAIGDDGSGSTDSRATSQAVSEGDLLTAGKKDPDAEGEGEEDEETVHAVRAKALRLSKDKDNKSEWAELGLGMLRLKKKRDADQNGVTTRRMLMRNSASAKIMINFNLHEGLSPSQTKKSVQFMGHEDGAAKTYAVRVGSETQAKELKAAMDRELAAFKAEKAKN